MGWFFRVGGFSLFRVLEVLESKVSFSCVFFWFVGVVVRLCF